MGIKFFLDTNVYDNLNYSFNNRQLSKVKDLITNGEIELLYNEIVYQEVRQHIADNIAPAVSQYNQVLLDARALAPYKNYDNMSVKLTTLDSDKMIAELRENWDSYLDDCFAEKIDIANVDVEDIINRYFKKYPPFETKKPYEFKDAIIIDSIRQYSIVNPNEEIYVISLDKGVRKAFKSNPNISTFSALYKAINQAISSDENLSVEISNAFSDGDFNSEVRSFVDEILYDDYTNVEDVYDEVDVISATCTDIDFEYLDYSTPKDSSVEASIIATATLEFVVEFNERDEDRSYYDKEDQEYLFEVYNRYKNTYSINHELEIKLTLNTESKNPDELFVCSKVFNPEAFYLANSDLMDSEIVETTSDEYEDYEDSDRYENYETTCPDCGCVLTSFNDAGGFCVDCVVNH